jgi:hypothetical protein
VTPSGSSGAVAFDEIATTGQSGHDGGATLLVGTTDASRATIARLIPNASAAGGRVLVAAFQGQQMTGGYTIAITAIERRGAQLVVHATFTSPGPGAMVTQALTSPAHVVSIGSADAAGLREAILLDAGGAELGRINTT